MAEVCRHCWTIIVFLGVFLYCDGSEFLFVFTFVMSQNNLGLVVQSIVSLTSSLRVFVNCFSRFKIQYYDIFC